MHRKERSEQRSYMYRERLGFGSSQSRSSNWGPPPASAASQSAAGVARYSFIHSVTQEPSRENGLGSYGRKECLSTAIMDPDRCYTSVLAHSGGGCKPPHLSKFTRDGAAGRPRAASAHPSGHGTAGDRCPAAAAATPTTCVYLPSVSSGGHLGNNTRSSDRPCSSNRMRDIWRLTFAPLDAREASTVPSSVFAAAPSTTNRDAFLTQQYTKTNILMRPSSGDSQRDAAYLPLTYLHDLSSPSAESKFRRFGDVASFNAALQPRPSSCTYRHTPATQTPRVDDDNALIASMHRSASRRECRCGSANGSASRASSPSHTH